MLIWLFQYDNIKPSLRNPFRALKTVACWVTESQTIFWEYIWNANTGFQKENMPQRRSKWGKLTLLQFVRPVIEANSPTEEQVSELPVRIEIKLIQGLKEEIKKSERKL